MIAAADPKVLVLRLAEDQGNFTYWVAELPDDEARDWKERLARRATPPLPGEIDNAFGHRLTLNEVMMRLRSRDFQVLDYPVTH
ncbi:MAG TPA: hypothetical protein VFE47_11410 [Tepidisphaeraceae bacterium]|jgi:hypothetical protein|nr:hypothetical protein [Tepidisphaeraceae bacterium]